VKHAGMALPDPIASAKSNYEASTLVNVLSLALKGNEEFHSADHKAISREVRSELKVRKKAKDDSELKSTSKVQCGATATIFSQELRRFPSPLREMSWRSGPTFMPDG
jgi:hypothetical protein